MATPKTRGWARLPSELVETIAAHLTEIVDHVRFSCVCAQWRSASKSIAADLPRQLPWLLLPKDDADASTGTRRFLSLARNRIFTLPLADSRNIIFNGTIQFPLPLADSRNRFSPATIQISCNRDHVPGQLGVETREFLNPLACSSIPLPPTPPTESMRGDITACLVRDVKVFDTNLVVVLFSHGSDLLFCRPGDDSWKRVSWKRSGWSYSDDYCSDFAYHNGKLFVLLERWKTRVFDMDTLEAIGEIPHAPGDMPTPWNYLVESSSGELLLVRRAPAEETTRFRVFRLDESEGEAKWKKASDIGDDALFVDGFQAMALPAADLNGWRGNCIYSVECLPGRSDKGVMMFDVVKARTEPGPLFTYIDRGYWGNAMWVVPSLC